MTAAPTTREELGWPHCEHCGRDVPADEYEEALEYCIECALLLGFNVAKEPTDG